MHGQRASFLSIAVVLLIGAVGVGADTLMKGSHPVVIGKGEVSGRSVQWTNCDGTERAKYSKPPYWVDKNHNCDMTPNNFGIGWEDGKYIVADPEQFGKYFPGVPKGTEVSFEKVDNGVVLGAAGQSLRLLSGVADDRGAQRLQKMAQSPDSTGSSGSMSEAKGEKAKGEKKLKGCIKSEGGQSVLEEKSGKTVNLTGSDVSAHNGHEVTVHGTWEGGASATASISSGAATAKAGKTFNVTSVDMISDSCHPMR